MTFQYANRATTQLARAISPTDTSFDLTAGGGDLFPVLSEKDQKFPITLVSVAEKTTFEICYVVARSADTLTVMRAQENTKARSFTSGDIVSLNMTARIFELFPQAGYMGIYNPDIVKTTGGYKKNALLADPQISTQFWVSLQDNNQTPPSKESPDWWASVNYAELGTKLGEFVSGTLGLRTNDTQGISLLTNGDTGQAHYKDNSGNSWDLAPQWHVDNVNSDLQALKADAVRGHGFSSGDKRITDIWANSNSRQRMQANLDDGSSIISARLEDVQDEQNRAQNTESNINNDLQTHKSHAIISDPFSNYDTRISSQRIVHDQPHPHVAVIGENNQYNHTLANLEDIQDTNRGLDLLKQEAVTGNPTIAGDDRIYNIYGNSNQDRQRLQVQVKGKKDIVAACFEDVTDERNRAQSTENNINNDLQDFKWNQAITSVPYSDYDTRLTRARIIHDAPYPHVAVQGEDSRYDHSLANLEDIKDTNKVLDALKQDAVTGHGYNSGDNRIRNIWANNNSDRQRLEANVEGRGNITTACIDDVWDERNRAIADVVNERNRAIGDLNNERNRASAEVAQERDRAISDVANERNRAQSVEQTLLSGTLGMGPNDKQGRGLHTNTSTGRANYWDETGSRGDLAYFNDLGIFGRRHQFFYKIVKNGDWIKFPQSLLNLQFYGSGSQQTTNVFITMSVQGNGAYGSGKDGGYAIWSPKIDQDRNGNMRLNQDGFFISIIGHWRADSDVHGHYETDLHRVAISVFET